MLSMRNTKRVGFEQSNRLNVAVTRARQQLVVIATPIALSAVRDRRTWELATRTQLIGEQMVPPLCERDAMKAELVCQFRFIGSPSSQRWHGLKGGPSWVFCVAARGTTTIRFLYRSCKRWFLPSKHLARTTSLPGAGCWACVMPVGS